MRGVAEIVMLLPFQASGPGNQFQKANKHPFAVAPLSKPCLDPTLNWLRKITLGLGSDSNQISADRLFGRIFGGAGVLKPSERPPTQIEFKLRPIPAD